MERQPPARGQRPPSPHRIALTVLTFCYGLGLAITAFLLVSPALRLDWRHRWAAWTRPPVDRPLGHATPRMSPQVKLQRAPGVRHRLRVVVRRSLPAALASTGSFTRWPVQGTRRVRMARRLTRATRQIPIQRARLLTLAPRRGPLPAWAPPRAPMPTWAHPPDPSLPPECRPRNPVVVGQ